MFNEFNKFICLSDTPKVKESWEKNFLYANGKYLNWNFQTQNTIQNKYNNNSKRISNIVEKKHILILPD